MARTHNRIRDTLLQLKDAGLVAADAAATVNSVAKVIDLQNGASQGFNTGVDGVPYCEFDVIIDITAIEIASNDELYNIILEGCNTADFSTGSPVIEPLMVIPVGAGEVIPGAGATDSAVGRIIKPGCNRGANGQTYRYLRIYTDVSGSIATGINFTADLAMRENNS